MTISVSLPQPATNLPLERDRMVGRHEEVDALDTALRERSRLVTLTGPPGVGKTRLAVHLGRLWRAVGEATAWADLAGLGSLDDLVDAVGRGLGIAASLPGDVEEARARLEAALIARERLLLVLDSGDALTPDALATLAGWLDTCDELRVLLTSRGALRAPGELVVEVAPLPADEAVALFRLRAQRVQAELPAVPDVDAALRRVVDRLDRLPLAIELAAARLHVMSLETLASRVASTAAGALGGGPLQAAIEEAWEQLAPAERDALAICAMFPASFDLEAAEAVIGDPATAATVLGNLRSRSLVVAESHDSGLRFHLLETVRELARQRGRDIAAAAGPRFACHFAQLGASLLPDVYGARAVDAVRRLATEEANLLAATELATTHGLWTEGCRLALALEPVLTSRHPPRRAIDVVAAAAQGAGAHVPAELGARAHLAHARLTELAGDATAAREALDRAHELAGAASALRAEILAQRGLAAHLEGRVVEALADLGAALDIARAAGDLRIQGHAHGLLLMVHVALGDHTAATEHGTRAVLCHERAGDTASASLASAFLGMAHAEHGDGEQARAHLEQALQRSEVIGDESGAALARQHLARVALDAGDGTHAQTLAAAAAAAYHALGLRAEAGTCTRLLAAVALEAGDAPAADRHLRDALDAHRELGGVELARDLAAIALVDALTGRDRLAAERLREAIRLLEARGSRQEATRQRCVLAVLEARRRCDGAAPEADLGALRPGSWLARIVARIGGDLLSPRLAGPGASAPLVVEQNARWFRIGDGPQVELSSRSPGRLVLTRLMQLHTSGGREALDTDGVFEAGWPGERASRSSARNRVYVTIRRLRAAGLEDVLLSDDHGYFLDPSRPASWFPEPPRAVL